MTLEQILQLVGVVSVILTLVVSIPAVRDSKVGKVLVRLNAVDVVGLARAIATALAKQPPAPPAE